MSKDEKYAATLAVCALVVIGAVMHRTMIVELRVTLISVALIVVIINLVKRSIKWEQLEQWWWL